jgi:uncharacterized protein (TIGR02246 family)
MPATFGRLYNARDKRAILDLYANDAMLTVDGTTVGRGKTAIADMMGPFFEGPLQIEIKCGACHENGGLAVVRSDWTLKAPDGSVAMSGSSAEVLRKEGDGLWRFVIDDATFSSRPR